MNRFQVLPGDSEEIHLLKDLANLQQSALERGELDMLRSRAVSILIERNHQMITTDKDPYVIRHPKTGKPTYRLNESLAKQQKVTSEQLANLVRLHERKLMLFDQMQELDPHTQQAKLKALAAVFEQIEYQLQENWNFTQDRNFHEWYLVPHCSCPQLDNQDRKGTPYRVITQTCPIHGKRELV